MILWSKCVYLQNIDMYFCFYHKNLAKTARMKKKLLLLGGGSALIPVIEKAKQLGAYVITCDYFPHYPAHKVSDEYHNVSIVDKEAVLQLATELKIDGIMSFATDPGVTTASYVAEKMNLPGVPYQAACILQNKGLFRRFLKENGFNVPEAVVHHDWRGLMESAKGMKLPVMVKPVDSAGSKGVSRIDRWEDLEEAWKLAQDHSLSKKVLMEEYIDTLGYASDSDCFSVDNELVFCSFSDQYFDHQATNPYTPAGFRWPSTMPMIYQEELKNEVQRLIRLLHLGTSLYNVETRVSKQGVPYIMEVSPRGGGNRLAEVLGMCSGVDLITASICHALGESLLYVEPFVCDGYWAEYIVHAERAGVFMGVSIHDDIKMFVRDVSLDKQVGEDVQGFTGANQMIGTVILQFESRGQMESYMDNLEKYIQVILT